MKVIVTMLLAFMANYSSCMNGSKLRELSGWVNDKSGYIWWCMVFIECVRRNHGLLLLPSRGIDRLLYYPWGRREERRGRGCSLRSYFDFYIFRLDAILCWEIVFHGLTVYTTLFLSCCFLIWTWMSTSTHFFSSCCSLATGKGQSSSTRTMATFWPCDHW